MTYIFCVAGDFIKTLDISKYDEILNKNYVIKTGEVREVIGQTIISNGPSVPIGELCSIEVPDGKIKAEVIGFKNKELILMPYSLATGVIAGSKVTALNTVLKVRVSNALIGRVIDGTGTPMDFKTDLIGKEVSVAENIPRPLSRGTITKLMPVGIKVIDGLLTIGKGQRIGIFSGSGVGKSTLLGMIANYASADVIVVCLIGERGREVNDFIVRNLGEDGLKHSVVVAATADEPALMRIKAAEVALRVCEYFRDEGKEVLLLMDSLTRFAMAKRETGIFSGEIPITHGYSSSVFSSLAKLLERGGNSKNGSITGIFTVLVDGDDMNEPISDAVRGILDGHIVLSRKIASRNHYPPIDITSSISRAMKDVISDNHKNLANKILGYVSTYNEIEDLVNIGAYVSGSNHEIDVALEKHEVIQKFLIQNVNEKFLLNETLKLMKEI